MGEVVDSEHSIPEKLRANAAVIVATFRENLDTELTYDAAGVERVDAYIERMRVRMRPEERWGLVSTLASFVGECIIHTYGGQWVEKDGTWGVQVNERVWANPFGKVEKQFDNGPEDSVAGFFRCIPALDQHLAQAASKQSSAVFSQLRDAGTALQTEASAELSIQIDPLVCLVDAGIDISIDGRAVGSGSFKAGVAVTTAVSPGAHTVGLKVIPKFQLVRFDYCPTFEIWVPESGSYILQLIYSRWTGFNGKYKLTRVGR